MDTRSIFTAAMLMSLLAAPALRAQTPAVPTDGNLASQLSIGAASAELVPLETADTTPELWPMWNAEAVDPIVGDSTLTVTGVRFMRAWALGSLGSLGGAYVGAFTGAVLTNTLEGFFLGGLAGSVVGSGLLAGMGAGHVSVMPFMGGLAGLVAVIVLSPTGMIQSLPVAAVIQALPVALIAATREKS